MDPMDALAEMSDVDQRPSVRIRWDIETLCPVCERYVLAHGIAEANRCLIQLGAIRRRQAS